MWILGLKGLINDKLDFSSELSNGSMVNLKGSGQWFKIHYIYANSPGLSGSLPDTEQISQSRV